MSEPAHRKATYEEYLAVERERGVKHEWIDGEVYAMAGGSPQHAALASRVNAAIARVLGSGPCVAFSSDLKLFIEARNRITYADVAVVCGPLARAPHDRDAVTNPVVLVEVLSDNTEAEDRGGKFADYGTLASLREYVLVDQHEPGIEVFHRNQEGNWMLVRHGARDSVRLTSVGAEFTVQEIYAGIELEPRRSRPYLVVPPPEA